MEEIYRQERIITPGVADAQGLLSIHDTLRLFMDAASVHATQLGVGVREMGERGLFWLTVRTKAVFLRRPGIGERVTFSTWPEPPKGLRANRSYAVEDERGERLISGKTEWAVMDLRTHELKPAAEVYSRELRFETPSACQDPFARIQDRFEPEDVYEEYVVRSTDIDMGGHMNNAAYVRAVLGSFTNEELRELPLRTLDVVYRASCYEREHLTLQRRQETDAMLLRVARAGETALLMRMA